jgi:hypothetical protein
MTYFIGAVMLAVMAWLVKYKKVTWLISGYNTASTEEQQKYDVDKLCRYYGNFLFILTAIMLIMAILSILLPNFLSLITWIGLAVLLITLVVGIAWMNSNNRVKKD